jgi:hypothetical protein
MPAHRVIRFSRPTRHVGFRIYEERFRPQIVFLELTGFPIGLDIRMDDIKPRITTRFPLAWAQKMGIVDHEYVARQIQSIIRSKARTSASGEGRFKALADEFEDNPAEKSQENVESNEE